MKQSFERYRNIHGKHYEHWTADKSKFDEVRREAKELGLSTKVIDGEIFREIQKLQVGKNYVLKHTGQFCHCCGSRGYTDFSRDRSETDRVIATFVGTIETNVGMKNIFVADSHERRYYMFSIENLNYIVK